MPLGREVVLGGAEELHPLAGFIVAEEKERKFLRVRAREERQSVMRAPAEGPRK